MIVATGRYLGEGFDDFRLDTLFLTMPIAWKGTLAQYAGRLHRLNDAEREVIIYDYVDVTVPVLARISHTDRRIGTPNSAKVVVATSASCAAFAVSGRSNRMPLGPSRCFQDRFQKRPGAAANIDN